MSISEKYLSGRAKPRPVAPGSGRIGADLVMWCSQVSLAKCLQKRPYVANLPALFVQERDMLTRVNLEQCEALGAALLSRVGAVSPVSAISVANACGLAILPRGAAVRARCGAAVYYEPDADSTQQESNVATELALWLMLQHGVDANDTEGTALLARVLMLPRDEFRADACRTIDLEQLQRRHCYAPREMIRARLVDVRHTLLRAVDDETLQLTAC